MSENLLSTMATEEELEKISPTDIMGIDGVPITVFGRLRKRFVIPDRLNIKAQPITFTDDLFVLKGLKGMLLLGNELISRAEMIIKSSKQPKTWLVYSGYFPYTIVEGYSFVKFITPNGPYHHINTPSGIRITHGVAPQGHKEPVGEAQTSTEGPTQT